ncbi:MAG: molybdate ABC transporter substrate-binding protein [Pseudomonadota bacterium]
MTLSRRRLFALAASAAVGARAGGANGAESTLVFAAASLRDVTTAAATALGGEGTSLRFSHAGTATLARQIEQGAPASAFLSADAPWMDYLAERGLIASDSRKSLATNALVLIAPHNAATVPWRTTVSRKTAIAADLGEGRLAVALTRAVPAGRYARAALQTLGQWETLRPRLAETDNVRTALALVARGEAPLGIVYATDARAEPRVKVIARFAPESHPPILYQGALVRDAPAPAAAARYLAFLTSTAGLEIFAAHGFGPPPPPSAAG